MRIFSEMDDLVNQGLAKHSKERLDGDSREEYRI
jgi:hypothetical protein